MPFWRNFARKQEIQMIKKHHPVVGVWYVRIFGAPFEHHLLTFNADGFMLQTNPHAGNAKTSDSIGMGPWLAEGNIIRAKFTEIIADHNTHKFISLGEILLELIVTGDTIEGTASACFYNQANELIGEPTHETVKGRRVVLNMPTPINE